MGHWVTLDDDQHVYISDSGKVLATRAAISAASGGTERGKALAARSKAAILKKKAGGAAKPAAEHSPKVREVLGHFDAKGQNLRGGDVIRKSLATATPADLATLRAHIDKQGPETRGRWNRWLGGELASEQRARAAAGSSPQPPARTATPGVAKATGRGTPERAAEAAKIAELRGKLRSDSQRLTGQTAGGARLSITSKEPAKFKGKLDAIKARVAERGERASEAALTAKDQARSSADTRRFGRELTPKERMARDAQAGGVRVKREAGNDYAGKRISDVPKSEGLTRARAVIAARATSQSKPAANPAPVAAKTDRAIFDQASRVRGKIGKHIETLAAKTGEPSSRLFGKHADVMVRETQLKAAKERAGKTLTSSLERITGKPPAPSLREQAAAARAGKGTAEERIGKLGARADERLRAVGTKSLLLGGEADKARAMASAAARNYSPNADAAKEKARQIDEKSLSAKKDVETLAGRTKSLRLAKDIAARLSALPKGSEQYNQAAARLAGMRIRAGKLVSR